jgi:hypothetical protein
MKCKCVGVKGKHSHKPKLNSQTFQVSKIFESRFGPLNLVQFGPCWKSLKKSDTIKWVVLSKQTSKPCCIRDLRQKYYVMLALCLCFYNKKKLASIHRVGLFDKKIDSSNGYKCNQTFIEWKMDCLNFLWFNVNILDSTLFLWRVELLDSPSIRLSNVKMKVLNIIQEFTFG